MPRGVRTRSAAPVAQGSAPMVLIEPVDDGSIRFNAYGLSGGAIVDVLRRSLLHVVALQAVVEVISMEVPAHGAVVASSSPTAKAIKTPKKVKPSVNGRYAEREVVMDPAEWSDESDV